MLPYRPRHFIVIEEFSILLMLTILLVSSTYQCILHLQTDKWLSLPVIQGCVSLLQSVKEEGGKKI